VIFWSINKIEWCYCNSSVSVILSTEEQHPMSSLVRAFSVSFFVNFHNHAVEGFVGESGGVGRICLFVSNEFFNLVEALHGKVEATLYLHRYTASGVRVASIADMVTNRGCNLEIVCVAVECFSSVSIFYNTIDQLALRVVMLLDDVLFWRM